MVVSIQSGMSEYKLELVVSIVLYFFVLYLLDLLKQFGQYLLLVGIFEFFVQVLLKDFMIKYIVKICNVVDFCVEIILVFSGN